MFRVEAVNTPRASAFGSTVVEVDLAEQWRAYEALSPAFREFLQEAPIDLDAVEVLEMVELLGEEFASDLYRESMVEWSAEYRGSFAQAKAA